MACDFVWGAPGRGSWTDLASTGLVPGLFCWSVGGNGLFRGVGNLHISSIYLMDEWLFRAGLKASKPLFALSF